MKIELPRFPPDLKALPASAPWVVGKGLSPPWDRPTHQPLGLSGILSGGYRDSRISG
ncbi:MAG: hypothetical protein GY850_03290 [bacterium]|nr:hypothetical protein [bacterium]